MLRAYYKIETIDSFGKAKKKTRKYKSKSFVRQFLQLFYPLASNDSFNVFDIGNVQRSNSLSQSPHEFSVAHPGMDCNLYVPGNPGNVANSEEMGIVIGTSTQAVAVTDFALITQIGHGTASGEMEYWGCWCEPPTILNPDGEFDIVRLFKNSSGGTITINEIGIYMTGVRTGFSGAAHTYCILRDVITPTAVDNGEHLKITYTLKILV